MSSNDRPVALVTGAARGLGAATAVEFAGRGYDVAITDVLADQLRAVASQITAGSGRIAAFPGDLAQSAFFQALVDRVIADLGRVDVLVNNAIWRELATMRHMSVESFEKTLRIGLTAPAFLARAAAVDMERRGHGVIINISSIMSHQASGMSPSYVAAKGGLESLTADLAALYGPRGVRVLAVRLGAIEAPTGEDYGPAQAAMRDFSENMIPLGRWASAAEVARSIAWLAGDEAAYIAGAPIVIDGGWSAQIHPRNLKARLFPSEF